MDVICEYNKSGCLWCDSLQCYKVNIIFEVDPNTNLEGNGCSSNENVLGKSGLLMNAMFIVFPKGDP